MTNSKRAFDRLLPLLDDFDVTAVDLPGHGAKAAQRCVARIPAMAAAVTPEIPGPCLLLGHSLGGVVATAIAERRPDRGRHVVPKRRTARTHQADRRGERKNGN